MYSKFVKLVEDNKTTAYRVAKSINIPASTFSDWKKGKSKPKLDKLIKIANHFDVPVTYFLDD